eukprot:167876-Chlamydomonas_euryale.AAC.2
MACRHAALISADPARAHTRTWCIKSVPVWGRQPGEVHGSLAGRTHARTWSTSRIESVILCGRAPGCVGPSDSPPSTCATKMRARECGQTSRPQECGRKSSGEGRVDA